MAWQALKGPTTSHTPGALYPQKGGGTTHPQHTSVPAVPRSSKGTFSQVYPPEKPAAVTVGHWVLEELCWTQDLPDFVPQFPALWLKVEIPA